jgi:hypothetical protein
MIALLIILAVAVVLAAGHAFAAWLRAASRKTDRLLSGEPTLVFRAVRPSRRSPDVQVTRVARVLDDMPRH